jgi:uncharacterized coiled-coil protein SlyX
MSYDAEMAEYVLELERKVAKQSARIEQLEEQLKVSHRLIGILDTQQQHIDF